MGRYKDARLEFFTEAEVPELSDPQRRMLNLFIDPEVRDNLDNQQIGELVGLTGREVGTIRTDRKFLDAMYDNYMPIVRSMVPDVLKSLHEAIREGDNTARNQWFKMCDWITDTKNQFIKITAEQVQIGIGQSLANLPGADYEVIEDEKKSDAPEGVGSKLSRLESPTGDSAA